MNKIYYENHLGEKVNLRSGPYRLITGTLLDYEWEETDGSEFGLAKGAKKKTLKMDIFDKRKEFHKRINALHEIFEKDVLELSPGRLYFGQSYINCYVIASEKSNWESDVVMVLTLSVLTDATWVTENPYTFHNFGLSSTSNKDYHGKYPYRYANGMNSNYIINPHFVASNFQMAIYGPVVNPQVAVGGVSYLVNIVLEDGEYLIIDSRTETIIKVMRNGEQVNAYHNRQKGRAFFRKIPPGRQTVSWTGKFDFDLTIYEERSEPKWIE